jgi:hypothetical protein
LLLRHVKNTHKYVDFCWVGSWERNPYHKQAHKLARQSARNAINPPLRIVQVSRKFSKGSIELGSVRVEKQRMSIRIITDQLLPQGTYKYKYEVISKGSPYYQKIDFIYSDILLKRGHCYSVRLNDDHEYPKIIKLFKELPKQKK